MELTEHMDALAAAYDRATTAQNELEDARAEAEVMARMCGYVVPAREAA